MAADVVVVCFVFVTVFVTEFVGVMFVASVVRFQDVVLNCQESCKVDFVVGVMFVARVVVVGVMFVALVDVVGVMFVAVGVMLVAVRFPNIDNPRLKKIHYLYPIIQSSRVVLSVAKDVVLLYRVGFQIL